MTKNLYGISDVRVRTNLSTMTKERIVGRFYKCKILWTLLGRRDTLEMTSERQ